MQNFIDVRVAVRKLSYIIVLTENRKKT